MSYTRFKSVLDYASPYLLFPNRNGPNNYGEFLTRYLRQ